MTSQNDSKNVLERKTEELYLLKTTEVKELRKLLWEQCGGICPILGIPVPFEDTALDHQHGRKKYELGENGNGECRGAISTGANIIEGKVYNAYLRTGLEKTGVSIPTILRNLADYLENPPCPPGFIHPSERPKVKALGKRVFSKIAKMYAEEFPNRKPLVYPASGKASTQI